MSTSLKGGAPYPNHNAVCERFHQTILHECWRPAFHRRHFTSKGEADSWLVTYHHPRRNHGDYMRGRPPHDVLDKHRRTMTAICRLDTRSGRPRLDPRER